jgi:hypothetical protein
MLPVVTVLADNFHLARVAQQHFVHDVYQFIPLNAVAVVNLYANLAALGYRPFCPAPFACVVFALDGGVALTAAKEQVSERVSDYTPRGVW